MQWIYGMHGHAIRWQFSCSQHKSWPLVTSSRLVHGPNVYWQETRVSYVKLLWRHFSRSLSIWFWSLLCWAHKRKLQLLPKPNQTSTLFPPTCEKWVHSKNWFLWKYLVKILLLVAVALKAVRKIPFCWLLLYPNDIFAHCSLTIYFLDFKFSNHACPSTLYSLIWLFLKSSCRKRKISENHPKQQSSSCLHNFVNRTETWYTTSTYPSAK